MFKYRLELDYKCWYMWIGMCVDLIGRRGFEDCIESCSSLCSCDVIFKFFLSEGLYCKDWLELGCGGKFR